MAVTLDRFRQLFAGIPMPVAVVAVAGADGVAGATVSSFCSLSAEPPLVLVALDRTSDTLQWLLAARRFSVNVLSSEQEHIARLAAMKGPAKAGAITFGLDGGAPRLAGAASWMACELCETFEGGDHVIVTGLVADCDFTDATPLVHHRRRFLPTG